MRVDLRSSRVLACVIAAWASAAHLGNPSTGHADEFTPATAPPWAFAGKPGEREEPYLVLSACGGFCWLQAGNNLVSSTDYGVWHQGDDGRILMWSERWVAPCEADGLAVTSATHPLMFRSQALSARSLACDIEHFLTQHNDESFRASLVRETFAYTWGDSERRECVIRLPEGMDAVSRTQLQSLASHWRTYLREILDNPYTCRLTEGTGGMQLMATEPTPYPFAPGEETSDRYGWADPILHDLYLTDMKAVETFVVPPRPSFIHNWKETESRFRSLLKNPEAVAPQSYSAAKRWLRAHK